MATVRPRAGTVEARACAGRDGRSSPTRLPAGDGPAGSPSGPHPSRRVPPVTPWWTGGWQQALLHKRQDIVAAPDDSLACGLVSTLARRRVDDGEKGGERRSRFRPPRPPRQLPHSLFITI